MTSNSSTRSTSSCGLSSSRLSLSRCSVVKLFIIFMIFDKFVQLLICSLTTVKLFIISMIFDKFVQLLSYNLTTVTQKLYKFINIIDIMNSLTAVYCLLSNPSVSVSSAQTRCWEKYEKQYSSSKTTAMLEFRSPTVCSLPWNPCVSVTYT